MHVPEVKPVHGRSLVVPDNYELSVEYILPLSGVENGVDNGGSIRSALHRLLCFHEFYSEEKEKRNQFAYIPFSVQSSYKLSLSKHDSQKNKESHSAFLAIPTHYLSPQELAAVDHLSSKVVRPQKAFLYRDNALMRHLLHPINLHVPY